MDRILTATQAAAIAGVDPHTIGTWARTGKLRAFRRPGGMHRRYYESDVRAAVADRETPDPESVPDDAVLGLAEAARLAGVHSATVARWCDEGGLAHERDGRGRRRIRARDVRAFVGAAEPVT